jgi:hypothetical protein
MSSPSLLHLRITDLELSFALEDVSPIAIFVF